MRMVSKVGEHVSTAPFPAIYPLVVGSMQGPVDFQLPGLGAP